jgi:hypothetical protein
MMTTTTMISTKVKARVGSGPSRCEACFIDRQKHLALAE